ncbi:interleukin-1 receptor-associated kinase 1-binding protein 1 homolog isoform X1 [Hypomesus transpacificus]|uniref:interleukin-1 receptor-associated kinase 1-binding protein 1 homolog isoform X1 n=2 Tax=Hypomesus transpacificus TaxID=137520 RepID=UPI001F0828AA|nr:interleukin-1 receptor-associated kinase 1-binding protein 1 homolog isoform X1 [Hypomesus transpacificus]
MYKDEDEPVDRGAQISVEQQIPYSSREIQVTGHTEMSCQADKASMRISLSNNKESVNDVSNSISRRVEYILQALRQHDVKEEEISMRKHIHREQDQYHMEAEVVVKFSDFVKMESVCAVLLLKLDKSVCVGMPKFYHSTEGISQLRIDACVAAVENARLKACEMSSRLGQVLGLPLVVREEDASEWTDEEGAEERGGRPPHRPTLTVSSRVFVSFNLRPRKKL